jgi:hypothetical protein
MILEVIAVIALTALAASIFAIARKPKPQPPFVWPPVTGPRPTPRRGRGGEVSEGKPND